MKSKPRRKVIPKRQTPATCYFCDKKEMPYYLNYEENGKFVTDRARIGGRDRSGLCSKHQRRLAEAVKRGRHLGLLPFKAGI